LQQALTAPAETIAAVRDQTLAAIALGHAPTLRRVVEEWWPRGPLAEIRRGRMPFSTPREVFALAEILHAIRDNLNLDLREDANRFFADLPPALLLRYYPAPWPAPENLYRIPAYPGARDPSLEDAALARAADLALTAFDTNAIPNQFLQGWLMNDRYLLRSAYGLPYEFLWANPYQPGLSYYHLPDVFHGSGRLYVRSSWDDDAAWFGYWDGQAQWFANGARAAVRLAPGQAPRRVGPSTVAVGPAPLRFETTGEDAGGQKEYAFVVLLAPSTRYDVEVDDEEMFEAATDAAGILALTFPAGRKAWVRVHAVRYAASAR
jgi:hypothetical protein